MLQSFVIANERTCHHEHTYKNITFLQKLAFPLLHMTPKNKKKINCAARRMTMDEDVTLCHFVEWDVIV